MVILLMLAVPLLTRLELAMRSQFTRTVVAHALREPPRRRKSVLQRLTPLTRLL